MLYVIALRYSQPYFSHDVFSIEHVLRNKDEGSCTMTQNISFFGIVNCDLFVTRKIVIYDGLLWPWPLSNHLVCMFIHKGAKFCELIL